MVVLKDYTSPVMVAFDEQKRTHGNLLEKAPDLSNP